MKAVRIHKFGGPENFKLEEVPIPKPTESQVLVRVHAAGINPVDTYRREGTYAVLPKLPAILGYEVAGVVEETGNDVNLYKKGDRVFACTLHEEGGGYAEYIAVNEEHVFPLAEKLTFSQGAGLFISYFTAYRALVTKCHMKPGEIALIHGASGAVGTAAVQTAKANGLSPSSSAVVSHKIAEEEGECPGKRFSVFYKLSEGLTVVGTAGSLEGMDLVQDIGADHVFSHKEKGYLNNAVAAIGGHGFDIVVENLANVNLGADLSVLNQNGRVAVVGCRGSVELNPRSLMLTEGSIIGVSLFNATKKEFKEAASNILKGVEDGWLNPVIAQEYELSEAAQAHKDIIHNRGARGKLVFKVI